MNKSILENKQKMGNFKLLKQSLSVFMVLVMVLGLLPVGTIATENNITVSVGVYDYTATDYGHENASDKGVVLDLIDVTVPSNSTALEVIKSVLDKEEIPYTTHYDYNYFSSINNLSEMDCGFESGWAFSVNDDFGNMGVADTTLSAADTLKLHYSVYGWGTDVGNYFNSSPSITTLTLSGVEIDISDHTTLLGEGTSDLPYIIPVDVPADTNVTNILVGITSSLHPKYISYGECTGLTDISEHTDYSNDITFCLQTIGGYHKTYYTVSVKKEQIPELPNYTGDWTSFRGNEENMGVTSAKTPRTLDEAELKWAVKHSSGFFETITPPILLNDHLYIAKGKKIIKIDPDDGKEIASSEEMVDNIGYALNPVTYGGGMIFVPVGKGRVQALNADTLESLWVSQELEGQTLTPVTYKNGYIYTGTWNSETREGTYFCLSITDEDPTKTNEVKHPTWEINKKGGFYWAGAYATDDYVIFGSDDGEVGDISETAALYSVHPTTGDIIDTIDNVMGDIRSTVSYDNKTDQIYFTTKGGDFYQVKVNNDGSFDHSKTKIFDLGGMCTGTPLVYNGLAYLGVAGSSHFSQNEHRYKIIDVETSPMKEVGSAEMPGYVQTSALLSTAYNKDTNKVYIYATYNNKPGGIYVIKVENTKEKDEDGAALVNVTGNHLFEPEGEKSAYCISSLVSDRNGVIYYKNDSGYLMAVALKKLPNKPPVKPKPDITVCVSMEKFTLGQGYIIEPTLVNIPKSTTVSVVITDLLKARYPNVDKPWEITGNLTESFYLSYVYDTNTTLNIPDYILSALGGKVSTRGSNTLLGEFDYSNSSGWMYSINGEFPDVGSADRNLNNKDVMRWQFSLYGLGADLDANNRKWNQENNLKTLADKDKLTWRVAEINELRNKSTLLAAKDNQSKYDTAMTVLTKLDSTQKEVDNALSGLNNLASINGSPGTAPKPSKDSTPNIIVTGDTEQDKNSTNPLFDDVEDAHWAKEYIDYLSIKGIINGKSEKLFAPDDKITRAEFVAILARISGDEMGEYIGEFEDVNKSDWFAGSVDWAVENNITKGVTASSFSPNDTITRQDMATMIIRFAQYIEFELPVKTPLINFIDMENISDYAEDAITAMQQAGIISGNENNEFIPQNSAIRAEASKMLALFIQEMSK